jgi:integrase
MARKSYQKGVFEWKDGRPTLRYRVRDPQEPKQWAMRRYDLDEVLHGCRDKKEIQRAIADKMAAVNAANNGVWVDGSPTLKQFTEGLWLMHASGTWAELKPSTVFTQQSILRSQIVPDLGAMKMDEITPATLTEFFAKKRASHETGYVANVYALLRSIFDTAVDLEVITKSPLKRSLHRPKYKRKKKPGLLPDEIQRVLECVREDFRVFLFLIATISVRIGEALAWRWQDFDEDAATLWIRGTLWQGKVYQPKTEGSMKKIQLPAPLVEALTFHRAQSAYTAAGDFIFARPDGSPCEYSYVRNYVLRPALQAAGIQPSKQTHGFHLFRRSASRILLKMTRNPKMVQDYLRHSRISTTIDDYVQEVEEMRTEAVELMAETLKCALPVPQESEHIN